MDVIIDNGSTKNLIAANVMSALKLHTIKHDKPYQLGWIKMEMQSW